MKLLFVHSTKVKEDKEGNLYTNRSYNEDVWNRYLSISSELSFIARKDSNIYDVNYAQKTFNLLDDKKIKFIEIPNLTSSFKSYLSIQKNKELHKIIKEHVMKSDCLIIRLPSSLGNIAIKYARLFNKPYLTEVVGCAWSALWYHSLKGKILALKSYLKMKKSVKNSPFIIYVTNEFLQRRYPTLGKSINCSNVVLQEFDDKVLENRLNKIRNKSKNDTIVLGTIGALDVRYKGQKHVIKAISKLNRQGFCFEYHLVGGGDKTYLNNVARKYDVVDKVKFLGSLSHENIFKYLDSIDIYIQPSDTEGLPRALIEAMSRGCPAIGTNVGGIPELLDDDCIFKKSDSNELASIIKSIGLNKDWLIKIAKRNFEEAKKYDKKVIEERRNRFLKEFSEYTKKVI